MASESKNFVGEWIPLGALAAGEHVIAIDAETIPLSYPAGMPAPPPINGLVFFARLNLSNGAFLRIGTGPDWETQSGGGEHPQPALHDDVVWDQARLVHSIEQQPWPPMPAMYLRREFSCEKPVIKARLYATALGVYEARLNGARVSDVLLTPEISQYAKRVLYRVYDVTGNIQVGLNLLGLTVGDGWYASWDGLFPWGPPPRRVLAQLELTFADGSRQIVATGPSWRIAQSPILKAQIRLGEVYDARLEQIGWDSPQFDDSAWQDAEVADRPSCRVVAEIAPPIRAIQTLKPCSISQLTSGAYVVDFGQNFAGWCRLYAKGDAGGRVELKFAELLSPSGDIDQSSMGIDSGLGKDRKQFKTDTYIFKGDESTEVFEPRFTYRGFRYVQITGLRRPLCAGSIEGIVVHSDLQLTGRLRVDSPLIEQTWRNIVWTQRSNFVGIPTDCPSREQRGWLGDAGVFWDAAAFNMDICAFTSRHMEDVIDDQNADGAFPIIAPDPSRYAQWDSTRNGSTPAWGDAPIILVWTIWQRYGNTAIIERYWDAMNRYLQVVQDHNPNYWWQNKRGWDFGDWIAVGEKNFFFNPEAVPITPKDLIATAYWAHSADLVSQMAESISRTIDAARLRALFENIRQVFNRKFVKSDGTVGNGSQTSYYLALKFGLLPEERRHAAAEKLAADILGRGISLTSGIVGTQFSLDVLADAGQAELAYSLLLRDQYPSWGYMICSGATTLWEYWSGETDSGSNRVRMSQNHPALGSIGGFLFRRIAGISLATPGFETIVIRPLIDPRVKTGGGDYDSVMGRISTDWLQGDYGLFSMKVTIPTNASAYIYLPATLRSSIQESGHAIINRNDIRLLSRSNKEAVVQVGSGSYTFVVD